MAQGWNYPIRPSLKAKVKLSTRLLSEGLNIINFQNEPYPGQGHYKGKHFVAQSTIQLTRLNLFLCQTQIMQFLKERKQLKSL